MCELNSYLKLLKMLGVIRMCIDCVACFFYCCGHIKVCIHIYIYIADTVKQYIYASILHLYMSTYIHLQIYTSIHLYIYAYIIIYASMHRYIHTSVHTCVRTDVQTHTKIIKKTCM